MGGNGWTYFINPLLPEAISLLSVQRHALIVTNPLQSGLTAQLKCVSFDLTMCFLRQQRSITAHWKRLTASQMSPPPVEMREQEKH